MQTLLESLYRAVDGAGVVAILTHNDPDPDGIASSFALRHLLSQEVGVEGHILYKGIVGRAENRALASYLGDPLKPLGESEITPSTPIALVDTQPGAGNNALSPEAAVAIVIDHHPRREASCNVGFADVRTNVGATSTILTEYLQAAELEPTPPVATALFYGIKTDTMGLGRGASSADVAAYFYVQPRIDVKALAQIERAQVPPEYFRGLVTALGAARVYDGLVLSYLGAMHRPDMAAEMADLLLRLNEIRWVICVGVYEEELFLSVRAHGRRGAGRLVQEIVGNLGSAGGHGTMGGGQVPLRGEDPERLARRLKRRALERLAIDPDTSGKELI